MRWSEEDIEFLKKNYNKSYEELSLATGRSIRALKHKVGEIGAKRSERKKWSDEEMLFLEENPELTAKEIAEKTGRSEFQVAHKLRKVRGTANRRFKKGWNAPSADLAYFLGAWCSDGYCNEYSVQFSQKKEDVVFLDEVQRIIESVLGVPVKRRDGRYVRLWACSDQFAKCVFSLNGKIAKPDWGELLKKKYSWVFLQEYFWYFMGGLYDGDGSLSIGYRDSMKEGVWESISLGIKPTIARKLVVQELERRGISFKPVSWDREGNVESIALCGGSEAKKMFKSLVKCKLERKLERKGNGFEEISRDQANVFLEKTHYLKGTLRPGSICYGGFKDGALMGVVAFASPISYIEQEKLLGKEYVSKVWELTRFATVDETGKNFESALLAQGLRKISERAWVVLSYADSKVGHKGTIYKATNAYYLGLTKSKKHKFVYVVARAEEKEFAKSVFMARNAKRLVNWKEQ